MQKMHLRKAVKMMLFTRTVAMVTVASFVISSVIGPAAYALNTPMPGAAQKIRESLSAFQLPYSIGRITDAKYLGSKKVVVAIQDLHCHPEVQRNIAKILGILDGKFGSASPAAGFKVFVEGGIGAVDTSWVNNVSDPHVRERAVETLMNAGRLTGSEYYSIKTGKHTFLRGLEDPKQYYENLARLNKIMDARQAIDAQLPEIKSSLAKLRELYYTTGNKRLDQIVADHEARSIETEKYYKLLLKLSGRAQIDPYYFPATANFLNIMALQRQLRHKSINRELTTFIGSLKEKVPFGVYSQLMEKASRPNGLEELYVTLAQLGAGMDLSAYPALAKFFTFVEKNQRMNPLDLVREERALIAQLRGRLSRSRAEREVAFIADFLQYVQAYYENRMSADDYAYYTENIAAFRQVWNRYAGAHLLPALDAHNGLFAKYYGVNIDRNRIFIDNIDVKEIAVKPVVTAASVEENIFLMNAQLSMAEADNDVAVLVTGGFHTRGLSKMLEEKGISYVVITPNVTGDTAYSQKMYDIIAREFVAGAGTQVVVSQTSAVRVLSRPVKPADDSLALPAVSNQLHGKTQDQILAVTQIADLQSAAARAAAGGISAEDIAAELNKNNELRKSISSISAENGNVVFTFKDTQRLSVAVAASADIRYSGKHLPEPRPFFNFRNPDGSPLMVGSINEVIELVAEAMARFHQDTVGTNPDLDITYLATLLWNSLPGRSGGISAADQAIVPAGKNGFTSSAMVHPDDRREQLGAEDHHNLPAAAPGELADVNLVQFGLNAGLGSSVVRMSYLRKLWERIGRRGTAKEGAKATDLYYEVEIGGRTRLISIAEAKLLQRILEADDYASVVIEEIVSTGDQDSKTSVEEMYRTENIYGRHGVDHAWGHMTYGEIAARRNVRIATPFVISFFPGPNRDIGEDGFPTPNDAQHFVNVNGSGSHGQPFFHLLAGAVSPRWVEQQGWMQPGRTTVLAITNSDGINNVVDDKAVKWVKDNGIPMTMIATTRTQLDVKGGIIGVVNNGKTSIKWMVERAVAKMNGQLELFGKIGVSDRHELHGEKGQQYFNTNTVVLNMSVLIPFLQDLFSLLGEERYLELISPEPIKSDKGSGEKQYWQYEGAMGTSILKISAFIEGKIQEGDPAYIALAKKHNIEHFLRILNVSVDERFDFFTPIKFAWDFWLQAYSDLVKLNTQTWKLDYQGTRGKLPEMSFPDGSGGSTAYYTDVQNMIDALGHASIVGLDVLDMQDIVRGGEVLLTDAVLKGTVRIHSAYSGAGQNDINLNDAVWKLPRTVDGRLLLENITVFISPEGKVAWVLMPAGRADDEGGQSRAASSAMTLKSTYTLGQWIWNRLPVLAGWSVQKQDRLTELLIAPFVAFWDLPVHTAKIVFSRSGQSIHKKGGAVALLGASAASALAVGMLTSGSWIAIVLAAGMPHMIHNVFKGSVKMNRVHEADKVDGASADKARNRPSEKNGIIPGVVHAVGMALLLTGCNFNPYNYTAEENALTFVAVVLILGGFPILYLLVTLFFKFDEMLDTFISPSHSVRRLVRMGMPAWAYSVFHGVEYSEQLKIIDSLAKVGNRRAKSFIIMSFDSVSMRSEMSFGRLEEIFKQFNFDDTESKMVYEKLLRYYVADGGRHEKYSSRDITLRYLSERVAVVPGGEKYQKTVLSVLARERKDPAAFQKIITSLIDELKKGKNTAKLFSTIDGILTGRGARDAINIALINALVDVASNDEREMRGRLMAARVLRQHAGMLQEGQQQRLADVVREQKGFTVILVEISHALQESLKHIYRKDIDDLIEPMLANSGDIETFLAIADREDLVAAVSAILQMEPPSAHKALSALVDRMDRDIARSIVANVMVMGDGSMREYSRALAEEHYPGDRIVFDVLMGHIEANASEGVLIAAVAYAAANYPADIRVENALIHLLQRVFDYNASRLAVSYYRHSKRVMDALIERMSSSRTWDVIVSANAAVGQVDTATLRRILPILKRKIATEPRFFIENRIIYGIGDLIYDGGADPNLSAYATEEVVEKIKRPNPYYDELKDIIEKAESLIENSGEIAQGMDDRTLADARARITENSDWIRKSYPRAVCAVWYTIVSLQKKSGLDLGLQRKLHGIDLEQLQWMVGRVYAEEQYLLGHEMTYSVDIVERIRRVENGPLRARLLQAYVLHEVMESMEIQDDQGTVLTGKAKHDQIIRKIERLLGNETTVRNGETELGRFLRAFISERASSFPRALAAAEKAAQMHVFSAGVFNPRFLREAVMDYLADPIAYYPALSRGIHAVIAPRITPDIERDAVARANATGANVVVFGSIASNDEEQYSAANRMLSGSKKDIMTRSLETSEGSVTLIGWIRQDEADAELMTESLRVAEVFRENPLFAEHANAALQIETCRDNYIGIVFSALELKYLDFKKSVLEVIMQNSVREPAIVKSAQAIDGENRALCDGALREAMTAEDYIDQLQYLNELTMHRNTAFTAPVPTVGALSPIRITTAGDVLKVIRNSVINNAKHNKIDTIFVNVSPDAWENAEVLLQLRAARDILQSAGLRMGFYEDVPDVRPDTISRFQAMVSLNRGGFGAEVVYLRSAATVSEKTKQLIGDIEQAMLKANPDARILLGTKDAHADGVLSAQDTAGGYILVTNDNLRALANNGNFARGTISMLILDEAVYGDIQSEMVSSVAGNSLPTKWLNLVSMFKNARQSTPAYAQAQGRKDGLRGTLDPAFLNASFNSVDVVSESVVDMLNSDEGVDTIRAAITAFRNAKNKMDASQDLQPILRAAGFASFNGYMDAPKIAYMMGYMEGVLENYFAQEEILDQKNQPVLLTQAMKNIYGKARLEQMIAGATGQPAYPLAAAALRDILKPVIDMDGTETYADVAKAVMIAVNDLSTYARRPEQKSEDRSMALAAIIELLRLYGERAVRDTVYDETRQIVPGLIRDMLGAA